MGKTAGFCDLHSLHANKGLDRTSLHACVSFFSLHLIGVPHATK